MKKRLSSHLDELTLKAREKPIDKGVRDEYERDFTAILYSKPFSRLRHKTQVFFDPKNDHICTRMEHSLHVASISRTIAESLQVNSQLAEAIGLGHDIGHLPFGHAGEELINDLIKAKCPLMRKEQFFLNICSTATEKNQKSLLHNINGFLWASYITNDGEGLNLTYAVREGILAHCEIEVDNMYKLKLLDRKKNLEEASRKKKIGLPVTIEGCIVRLADMIAFRARDFEDCIRAKIIKPGDIPKTVKSRLGKTAAAIVDSLIDDLVNINSNTEMRFEEPKKIKIGFSSRIIEALEEFSDFFKQNVYEQNKIVEYKMVIKNLVFAVYDYLLFQVKKHGDDLPTSKVGKADISYSVSNFYKFKNKAFFKDWPTEVVIVYFIAGCSDKYIQRSINDILTLV